MIEYCCDSLQIGSSLGGLQTVYTTNDNCRGGTGFCPSGCGNTWKLWNGSAWVTDSTLTVTCKGKRFVFYPNLLAQSGKY